jgi:hypothetical protein
MGMSSSKKAKGSKSPIPPNPKSIADFGYHWIKDDGSEDSEYKIRLKPIAGGDFKWEGQQHYDKLAEFVVQSLQDKMQEEFDLERVMMPLEKDRGECNTTFPIFHSKDIATNAKIVVIVLGAGRVELGQWSRALCMNQSLAEGSLMPFLHEAVRVRGCAVLLTNPNINSYIHASTKRLRRIPGHGSPEDHLKYLYRHYLANAAATEISIIAHSFGGVSTMTLLSNEVVETDFFDGGRLKSVTLTDSVHIASLGGFDLSKRVKKWLLENAINYVRSGDPLGTKYKPQGGTQRQSAGTDDHASTSYYCRKLLWGWIDDRMTKEALPALPAKPNNVDDDDDIEASLANQEAKKEKSPRRSKRLANAPPSSSSSASSSAHTSSTQESESSEKAPKKTSSKKGIDQKEKSPSAEEDPTPEETTEKSKAKRQANRARKQSEASSDIQESSDSHSSVSDRAPAAVEPEPEPKRKKTKAKAPRRDETETI